MTKKQKIAKTKKQVREMIKGFEKTVLENVEKAVNSGMISDETLQADDHILAKAVLHGSMMDKPYAPFSPYAKEFENIARSF